MTEIEDWPHGDLAWVGVVRTTVTAVLSAAVAACLIVSGWLAAYAGWVGSRPEYSARTQVPFDSMRTPVNVTILVSCAVALVGVLAMAGLPRRRNGIARGATVASGVFGISAMIAIATYYSVFANRPDGDHSGSAYAPMLIALRLGIIACGATVLIGCVIQTGKWQRIATAATVVITVAICAGQFPWPKDAARPAGLGPVVALDMHHIAVRSAPAISPTPRAVELPELVEADLSATVGATESVLLVAGVDAVVAYNGDTLTARWRRSVDGIPGLTVGVEHGISVVVVHLSEESRGLDPLTGAQLWASAAPRHLSVRDADRPLAAAASLVSTDSSARWLSNYSLLSGRRMWTRDLGNDCASDLRTPPKMLSDTVLWAEVICAPQTDYQRFFNAVTGTPIGRPYSDWSYGKPTSELRMGQTASGEGPSELRTNDTNRLLRTFPSGYELTSCNPQGPECIVSSYRDGGLMIWTDGSHPDVRLRGNTSGLTFWLRDQIVPGVASGDSIMLNRKTLTPTPLHGDFGCAFLLPAGLVTLDTNLEVSRDVTSSLYPRVTS